MNSHIGRPLVAMVGRVGLQEEAYLTAIITLVSAYLLQDLQLRWFSPGNLDQDETQVGNNDFNGFSKTIPMARWIDCLLEPGKNSL